MIYEKSATQIHDAFIKGELSATEIAQHFLKRIELLDSKVGSFLKVFPESVLEKAKELDQRRAYKKPLGKLAAVPIAIKDNIHIKGEKTTCASKIMENYNALFDATCVRLLKEEDALIIGKTNLDEFAMGGATEYSAFKSTHNPWCLNSTPGGSSGGSSACVAARLAPLSLGSDTGGSVRQPASYCGLVGYKPTYGRFSRYGLVAFGSSLDQVGPFAYNTEDLALISEVLAKHCPHDATSIQQSGESFKKALRTDLKGIKVGVPYKFLENLSAEVKENFQESLEHLKKLGAELIDVNLDLLKYAMATYYIIATAEASTNLARFDGIRYGYRDPHAHNIDQVYDLSRENGFGPEVKRRILLGTYVLSSGFYGSHYKKALGARGKILEAFQAHFEQCDMIVMPTAPTPAFETGSFQNPTDMYLMDLYTVHANLTGLPALSVPAGFSNEGKPLGFQMIGRHMEDAFLIGCAHALEKCRPDAFKIPPLAKEAS